MITKSTNPQIYGSKYFYIKDLKDLWYFTSFLSPIPKFHSHTPSRHPTYLGPLCGADGAVPHPRRPLLLLRPPHFSALPPQLRRLHVMRPGPRTSRAPRLRAQATRRRPAAPGHVPHRPRVSAAPSPAPAVPEARRPRPQFICLLGLVYLFV